jgi:hypothetical protein
MDPFRFDDLDGWQQLLRRIVACLHELPTSHRPRGAGASFGDQPLSHAPRPTASTFASTEGFARRRGDSLPPTSSR